MTKNEPTWRDLYNFIQEQIAKEGDAFLDNKIYFEMVDPIHYNQSFKTIEDSEGWKYIQPAWLCRNQVYPLCTFFKDKKIVTLNVNY